MIIELKNIEKSFGIYRTNRKVVLKNIDLTKVYEKIDSIDGLAKFNVAYSSDTKVIAFYNGDKVIKSIELNTDPSATWVSSYNQIVDNKISEAISPVQTSLMSA